MKTAHCCEVNGRIQLHVEYFLLNCKEGGDTTVESTGDETATITLANISFATMINAQIERVFYILLSIVAEWYGKVQNKRLSVSLLSPYQLIYCCQQ